MALRCLVACIFACFVMNGVFSLTPAEKVVFEWILEHGGEIHATTGVNKHGVRGLFATRAMKRGDLIARIPSSTVINVGNPKGFTEPAISYLREAKNNCSRFKPYFDYVPERILNGCNFPKEYLHMFESPSLEKLITGWHEALRLALTGEDNHNRPMTLKEAVGLEPVTFEELQHACALTATRYVNAGQPRHSYIIAAVFDLCNHKHGCKHGIRYSDQTQDYFEFIAGSPLKKGQEICYHYGVLPDDYAIIHYGFLPKLEKPPRMCDVDLHTFDHQNFFKTPERVQFKGTPSEMKKEIKRLQDILSELLAKDAGKDKEDAKREDDWLYNLMREYQKRRRSAIDYEIKRLQGRLEEKTPEDAEEL